MNSTHDEREAPRAFSGVDRLHGRGAHAALERAAVLVVGIGGVGSWATEALARSGVGRIALADLDHVAESNINRQIQALVPTLGMAKTEAMAQRIAAINPACVVTSIEDFVSPGNVAEVLGAQYDAVIDSTDQVSAKVAIALHCHAMRIKLFMAGAAGGRTDPTRIRCADVRASHRETRADRRRIKELERELRRRDRALAHQCAPAAAPLILTEQTVLILLAPQKDLVGVDVVLARDTRHGRAGCQRCLDHGTLERHRMTLRL